MRQHMGYYPTFRWIIPHFRANSLRVTNQFAAGLNPLDLHALSTLPAFVLSQDQTLNKRLSRINRETIPTIHLTDVWRTHFYFKVMILSYQNLNQMLL